MGTRNLIAVFIDGRYKVAQYGQWDGYPEGQGLGCLHFLRDEMDEELFKTKLNNLDFINSDSIRKLQRANPEDPFHNYPEFDRDTGSKILKMIQNGSIHYVRNDIIFATADDCEWAYVIDFDSRTFEVYENYFDGPCSLDGNRFLKFSLTAHYMGVLFRQKWSLDNLPSDDDFLAYFKKKGE